MELSGNNFKNHALELGRNLEFAEQIKEYADILLKANLPVIFSPTHLALAMGKEYTELQKIIKRRESYYKEFLVKKNSGGHRQIIAPQGELKMIQYWIKQNILDKIIFHECVTAYQANKSIYTNALPHVNKELVMKFDLKDYFSTISQARVFGLFQIIGYHKSVALDLAKLCCVSSELMEDSLKRRLLSEVFPDQKEVSILPQGAPTSPAISNLAAIKLDVRLLAYAKGNEYNYTRYADDLTFSGTIDKKLKKNVIKRIVTDSGFVINERKGSYAYKSNKQLVTGLTVNHKVSIPKKKRKEIETHLHNCIQFGPFEHLKKAKPKHTSNYRDWLLGNILYIYSIHPEAGKRMKEKFDRINWL